MRKIPRVKYDPSASWVVPLESDMGSVRMVMPEDAKPEAQVAAELKLTAGEDRVATQVKRELVAAKPALAQEVARRVSRVPIQQLEYAGLPFSHPLAMRITAVLREAVAAGEEFVWGLREWETGRKDRGQVSGARFRGADDFEDDKKKEEEAAAAAAGGQGAQGDTSQKPPPDAQRNELDVVADAVVADYQNWMTARARGAAIDGLKDGLTPEQIEQKVERTITQASDGAASRAAIEGARQAAFVGTFQALKELQDEVIEYVRAEARDDHTCAPCMAGSDFKTGMRWKRLEDVNWRPGDDCEGGDACRGRLVARFRTGMYVIENGKKRWIEEK